MSPLRPPSDPPAAGPAELQGDALSRYHLARHHPTTVPVVTVDPVTPVSALVVLAELASERVRQIAKGYDAAHDDAHTMGDFLDHLRRRMQDFATAAGLHEERGTLIVLAAVAVAVVESIDRRLHPAPINLHADAPRRPCDTEG